MMRKLLRALGLTFCAALIGTAANASPIVYSEAISGDFGGGLGPYTLLTLDVGVNTVSGTTHITNINGLSFDTDYFAFVVPTGTQLMSLEYSFVPTLAIGAPNQLGYVLDTGNAEPSFPFTGAATIDINGAPSVQPFAAVLFPLQEGTYTLGTSGGSIGLAGFDIGYTWRLDVHPVTPQAVPEPASLLLLGSGLAGLAAKVRKRRTQFNTNRIADRV